MVAQRPSAPQIRFGDGLLRVGDTVRVQPGVAFGGELATVVHIARSRPLSRSLISLKIGPVMTVLFLDYLDRV